MSRSRLPLALAAVAATLFAAVVVVGCLNPSPADGALGCSPTGKSCPDGYSCDSGSNTCWRNGHVPGGGKPRGSACAPTDSCAAGLSCVDGYCCNDTCAGQCRACDVAGSEGTCSPVTSGNPHGGRDACSGAGTACAGSCSAASETQCAYPTSGSCASAVTLTLDVTGAGTGTVACTLAGATCPAMIPIGSMVTLTPSPDYKSVFRGWASALPSFACAGTGPCMLSIDGTQPAITVTATFQLFPISHVAISALSATAPNLSGVTAINTDALTVTGAAAAPPFALDVAGNAVMSVGTWTVDQNVTVTGSHPLVVAATGAVDVQKIINAAAVKNTPGPGGFAAGAGPAPGPGGAGGYDTSGTFASGGGGGAGYGSIGKKGADSTASAVAAGGTAGGVYLGALADFKGGAGGGGGGASSAGCIAPGGAGGGAVQITSTVSITIQNNAGINVGGGGGGRGLVSGCNGAGGGGGAGGEIFLEAPTVSVIGTLAANGGGGGSGACGSTNNVGNQGADGTLSVDPAPGGVICSAGATNPSVGGVGDAIGSPALSRSGTGASQAGGSGGGMGVIWVRTRGAWTPGAKISPAAKSDITL